MPVVRAVPALVVPTMAAVNVDVYVALGSPALPVPLLLTMVSVPVPAELSAPVASAGRAVPASAVAPMAAVDVAPTAALQPCGLTRRRQRRWRHRGRCLLF